jgi:hypothetical protein
VGEFVSEFAVGFARAVGEAPGCVGTPSCAACLARFPDLDEWFRRGAADRFCIGGE